MVWRAATELAPGEKWTPAEQLNRRAAKQVAKLAKQQVKEQHRLARKAAMRLQDEGSGSPDER